MGIHERNCGDKLPLISNKNSVSPHSFQINQLNIIHQPFYTMQKWFIFLGNSLLLKKQGDSYSVPEADETPTPTFEWTTIQELPMLDNMPCKAYSLTTPPRNGLPESFVTVDLRQSYYLLPRAHYFMAAKASELLYWDNGTRYCGVCGAPMKRHTAISKQCTHCGKEVWPQVAPAIIVRIKKAATHDADGNILEPEKILLVHARNFRHSERMGLVAGFVETGETLEECVVREVHEEVQLDITNIRYFGSQPWPYPCGIMIGFTADYVSGNIHLQEEELSRGSWFSRDKMPEIPDKMSIARQLIDDWLHEPR